MYGYEYISSRSETGFKNLLPNTPLESNIHALIGSNPLTRRTTLIPSNHCQSFEFPLLSAHFDFLYDCTITH